MAQTIQPLAIDIHCEDAVLAGDLQLIKLSPGLVIFAHGSGSSRFSPRNRYVAHELNQAGLSTLLFDLLTTDEENIDQYSREYRFNIQLLTERLVGTTRWLAKYEQTQNLKYGYFGASTGAAAALMAAAILGDTIKAVVSRGGRPDLAADLLPQVVSPTLLIVGGEDHTVIELNQQAYNLMTCLVQLQIVPHATHLFEEPGTLEQVIVYAKNWYQRFLTN